MLPWGWTTRWFPVLARSKKHKDLGVPGSVPWTLLVPHIEQAQRNHGQTLDHLAERGGLSPAEICAVIEDRRWRHMTDEESAEQLIKHLLALK